LSLLPVVASADSGGGGSACGEFVESAGASLIGSGAETCSLGGELAESVGGAWVLCPSASPKDSFWRVACFGGGSAGGVVD